MASIHGISDDERNDIINALRHKAQGDRKAAAAVLSDQKTNPGLRSLADTLNRQADRQEALADRLDE